MEVRAADHHGISISHSSLSCSFITYAEEEVSQVVDSLLTTQDLPSDVSPDCL